MAVAIALALTVDAFLLRVYAIPTSSMRPLLQPGDRVVALRVDARAGDVRRGDVVVVEGFGADRQGSVAKRVIGVGGDRVTCCLGTGALSVNGQAAAEPYLYPGDEPSDVRFDVVVPPGRLWLMGDHRSVSADSRAHLGDPGGGMVRKDRLVGRIIAVVWPLDRIGGVGRTDPVAEAAAGGTS